VCVCVCVCECVCVRVSVCVCMCGERVKGNSTPFRVRLGAYLSVGYH
jgi:hypothetical protein